MHKGPHRSKFQTDKNQKAARKKYKKKTKPIKTMGIFDGDLKIQTPTCQGYLSNFNEPGQIKGWRENQPQTIHSLCRRRTAEEAPKLSEPRGIQILHEVWLP